MELGSMFFNVLKMVNPAEISMVDALGGKVFTYGDLFEGSTRLARMLGDLGLKRGDVVGVVSENRPEFYVPVLACFYKQLTVHPMNAKYTTSELKLAYNSTKPKVIFTTDESVAAVSKMRAETDYIREIISFDGNVYRECVAFGEALRGIPEDPNCANEAALILSSSGTTGLPKGVVLTRANIKSTFTFTTYPFLHFSPVNVTIGLMPFHHIFGFLLALASIYFLSKVVVLAKFNADLYCEIIQEHKVATIHLVPTIAVFLAKHPVVDKYDLTSVKDVVCGAAPLGLEIQRILEKKFNCTVRQIYGMTEACGVMCGLPLGVKPKAGSSGLPLPGLEVRIVAVETGRACDAGKRGEICVRSALNMKGYIGNERASDEARTADGFLRTGDIGFLDHDGYIFVVDRLKDLIKYKGFQVSPAELEDLLVSHGDVVQAGVVGIADERVGQLPMAFVVKHEHSELTEIDIVKFVEENVSVDKRLRGGVKFVQEIPTSPTGKIIRKELQALAKSMQIRQ